MLSSLTFLQVSGRGSSNPWKHVPYVMPPPLQIGLRRAKSAVAFRGSLDTISSLRCQHTASTSTSVAVRVPSLLIISWYEWSLHSTLHADSATVAGLTSSDAHAWSPVNGHSDVCGGVLIELMLAASMNQSLMTFKVHSFVSSMLRSVSLGWSPTRLNENSGGCNGLEEYL